MIYLLIFLYPSSHFSGGIEPMVQSFKRKDDACGYYEQSESTPKSVWVVDLKKDSNYDVGAVRPVDCSYLNVGKWNAIKMKEAMQ